MTSQYASIARLESGQSHFGSAFVSARHAQGLVADVLILGALFEHWLTVVKSTLASVEDCSGRAWLYQAF